MSDETENEPLDLTEGMAVEGEQEAPEQHEEPEEYTLEIEGEDADDDDVAIESLPEDQRSLPKKLRERLLTEQREKAELQKRVTAYETAGTAPVKIEVGEKPTLEGCDWDPEKFETDLTAWQDRKRKAEDQDGEAERDRQARLTQERKFLENYLSKKAALPMPQDKKDAAEKLMAETLPVTHQNGLLQYTDDPAKVAVALANAPNKLAALAREKDPIRFIIAVREMEGKIMVNRKKPPAPESSTIVRGSAPMSGNTNKSLEKLEAEAAKTGDRSKLIAARSRMRSAA